MLATAFLLGLTNELTVVTTLLALLFEVLLALLILEVSFS